MDDTINKEKGSPWNCGVLDKVAGVKPTPHKFEGTNKVKLHGGEERVHYIRGYLSAFTSATNVTDRLQGRVPA